MKTALVAHQCWFITALICSADCLFTFVHVLRQNLTNEEDFLQMATSDVSQLCAENVILWTQHLEMVTLHDKTIHHLACEHHTMRVGHKYAGQIARSSF